MKIKQEKKFQPVTIVFKEEHEWKLFMQAIDVLDNNFVNSTKESVSVEVYEEIVRPLSDFTTDKFGYRK